SSLVSGASYTPYPRLDGESDWNSSQLFSWRIPLRYRFKTTGSVSGKLGELSWQFPYYSDPYVDRDFLNRSEFMDWFRIIQEGAAMDEASTDTTLSGYEWRLTGRPALSAPRVLSPYVSSFSFSNFYSAFTFNYRDSEQYRAAGNTYSPSRRFYFPDKFTLYSLSFSIGGTPLTLGNPSAAAAVPREEAEDPLKDAGTLKPPWEERETPVSRQIADPSNLAPPTLEQRFDLGGDGGPRFSIDYRINPAAISELQYRTGIVPGTSRYHWQEAEDIDWGDISSILSTVRGDASTSFALNHPQGAYTTTFRLRGSGAYQNYFYANEEAEEFGSSSSVRQALDRVYNATFFTTNYDYSATVKPLYRNEMWGNSSISYSFDGLLVKSVFDSGSIPPASAAAPAMWDAEPRWDIEYGAWDKEYLSSHQLSTVFNANVMDKVQNLTLTMTLPPRDASLSGNLTSRIWIGEFNANMRIQEPWEEEKRKLEPLYFTGTFRFGDLGYLRQYMVFDMEEKVYSTLTTQLSIWGFTAGFTAVHSVPYEFDFNPATNKGNGWVQRGDAVLHPQDLRFGFSKSLPALSFQDKRISLAFNANSSLLVDLQRYTYSRFDLNLGFTFGFKDLLDVTFSVTSDNSVMYRYLRNIPGLELPITTTGETNIFRDLLNSFRFDNPALRTESGFKLKSLNLKATHYMGDWNATLGITLAPYLKAADTAGGIPSYQFNTQVSFLVQWLPISEIKSELSVDKDQWVFK
ncbi:MAG: LPS-assembly protein LptD, partial [Treponema sp.]|nr:LPS-assembly protein LptD [Treponema sp.]